VIIFSATDDLSGVKMTEYSFDENNWTEYTGPFYISTEGETTIYYRTHDLAGNIESTNYEKINLDRSDTSNLGYSPLIIYVAVALATISIIAAIVIMRRKYRKHI